jgi:hypothetical protein
VFTLSNGGTQPAANIMKAVSGPGFSLPTPSGTDCGTTLGANPATCTIRVRFTPPGLAGNVTGTLTVTAAAGAPAPVPLTANAYGITTVPLPANTPICVLGGMDGAGVAVVGRLQQSGANPNAYYWKISTTTTNAITIIPPVSGEADSGDARAISSNGMVVTGLSDSTGTVWTWSPGAANAHSLSLNTATQSFFPLGIDKTGSVIVGDGSPTTGFVWRSAVGLEALIGVEIVSVSDNGTMVGLDVTNSWAVWTSGGNITLGATPLNGGSGNAISGDASVIVGSDNNGPAARWLPPFTALPQDLPFGIPNATAAVAIGVNQTGSFIVGTTINPATSVEQAMEWTVSGTTVTAVNITTALAGAPNIASFQLQEARFVSTDGKTIAGMGILNNNPQMDFPWIARLP